MGCLDAVTGPGELLPLPDIRSINIMIVGDAVWAEKALKILFVLGEGACRLEEELVCESSKEVSSDDKNKFGGKAGRKEDDVVEGDELLRDTDESSMEESSLGEVERHLEGGR